MGTVELPLKGSLPTTVVEGPTDELGGCVVGGATEVVVVDSVVVVVSQSFGALTVVSLLPPAGRPLAQRAIWAAGGHCGRITQF
jgi:hypothetical protein